jgi:Protein of unknown function (DUF2442)
MTVHRITQADAVGDHRLHLTFEDGATGLVDFSGEHWTGDMASLADPDYFEQVAIQPRIGTVVWPNGVEMSAEALYETVQQASGHPTSWARKGRLRRTALRIAHGAGDLLLELLGGG